VLCQCYLCLKRMELGGCVSIVSISEFNGNNTDGESID